MTPFGQKLRDLRAKKGVDQKTMAGALGVSPAYLSALENGKRGVPSWEMLQRMLGYFNIIWDEAEDLIKLAYASHPRVKVDTSDLSLEATLLANRLAEDIGNLSEDDCRHLIKEIERLKSGA